jgi:hypothetical protein
MIQNSRDVFNFTFGVTQAFHRLHRPIQPFTAISEKDNLPRTLLNSHPMLQVVNDDVAALPAATDKWCVRFNIWELF